MKTLEEENASLRSQVERLSASINSTGVGDSAIQTEKQNIRPERANPRKDVSRALSESTQENERLQEELKRRSRDYEALCETHNFVLDKYKKRKELCKQWQVYHEKMTARDIGAAEARGGGRQTSIRTTISKVSTPANMRSSSNSFDQDPVDSRVTHTTGQLTGTTRMTSSTVVDQSLSIDRQDSHHSKFSRKFLQPKSVAPDGCQGEVGSASSETNVDSESHSPKLPTLIARGRSPSLVTVLPIESKSDRPVIISERSLKRKTVSAMNIRNVVANENARAVPGSMSKPVLIKSEQDSSSPSTTKPLQPVLGTHDSMDLDEVGYHVFTPRKRRRLQDMVTKSQRLNRRTIGTAIEQASEATDNKSCAFDEHISDVEERFELNNDPITFLDKEHYAQIGRHYGISLWEEDQRNANNRRQSQARPDAQVIEKIGEYFIPKLPRQRLHNQKVHQRQIKQIERLLPSASIYQHDTETTSVGKSSVRAQSEPMEASSLHGNAIEHQLDLSLTRVVLRPTNPNVQILPRTSSPTSSLKRLPPSSRRDRGAARVPFLAEDGEDGNQERLSENPGLDDENISDTSISQLHQTAKVTEAYRRLGSLLTEPSPEKPLLSLGKAAQSGSKPCEIISPVLLRTNAVITKYPTIKANEQQPKPAFIAGKLAGTGKSTRTSLLASQVAPEALPEDEPLRARPLQHLRLDDFKINSARNQGLDFAFNEVIRNRDQRKCLLSCSKPDCCGDKFRQMVKVGGYAVSRQTGLWNSLPMDEIGENQRLLEEYLGNDVAALRHMSATKKQELLVHAKAKQIADEYGKHRRIVERGISPPGFWRTDMPTTQENAVDKEAARTAERQQVEERYREAMRTNGRWLFRDE